MTPVLPQRPLGRTGLQTSSIALGGNRFGSSISVDDSFRLLDAFVEAGGTVVDTALVYADWVPGVERSCSEKTIGRWLAARGDPDDVTVVSKGGHPDLRHPEVPRLDGNSIRHDVELTVAHLGGRPLRLYVLHRDDPTRPIADILGTLEELVADGWIQFYGASNFTAPRLREADACARKWGYHGFVAHQVGASLAQPDPDRIPAGLVSMDADLAEVQRGLALPVMAYSAQAKGFFDKVGRDGPLPDDLQIYNTAANRRTAQVLAKLAPRYGLSCSELALAALAAHPLSVLPVVGAGTVAQMRSSVVAATTVLDPDDRRTVLARVPW